jgi:hypothetical protein
MAAKRQYDLMVSQAWHTAVFGLNGYAGKLNSLPSYLGRSAEIGHRSRAADAIAFFHRMKAQGLPVKISRVPRKTKPD